MNEKNLEAGTLNNPDLNASGEVTVRAITSGEQAYSIATKLEQDHIPKNNIDAVVDEKYNGGLPRKPDELRGSGESWRHNFSTNFMSGIISKIIPAPVGLVDGARYLTTSRLCTPSPEMAEKTEIYRDHVTKTIRGWDGWKSFNYRLWTEVVLHGAAIVLFLNKYLPWPEIFRQDQAFVPQGTGQEMKCVPVLAAKKDYLIHEFCEFISDRDSADSAGWNTQAAIDAVNKALPKVQGSSALPATREYQDAIREGNIGASFSGADVIETWHVLATEPKTQKVTHYIVNRNGKHEILFQKDDEFDSMEDVGVLFTLEPGNSTLYGSKGVGRILLNMSIACEANRNLLFDQLRIAGMNIVQTDQTKSPTIEMQVQHPFLVLISDGTLQQTKLEPNVEAFSEADNMLARWAEQAAGSYISDLTGDDGGAHPTATEENIRANRERQFKIAFLSRAWGQVAELVSVFQKRFLDKESIDDAVKTFQKYIEDAGITDEEHKELALSATAEVAQDQADVRTQKILAAYQVAKDDPDFDQYKLKQMVSTALVDSTFTEDVLLDPNNLQANEIEAYRQQILENVAMIGGDSVPVSPRDLHEVHLKTGFSEIQRGLPQIAKSPNPKMLDSVNMALRHLEGHVGEWEKGGATPQQLKPFKQAAKVFEDALMGIAQTLQKNMQSQQQAPQGGNGAAGGPPASPEGQQGSPEAQEAPTPSDFVKMYVDDGTPQSIKRQIEAGLGLKPASDIEHIAMGQKQMADVQGPAEEAQETALPPSTAP